MIRTQIQLTEEQARRLRALAARREVSLAELIREGVDAITTSAQGTDAQTRQQQAIAVAGRFHSGRTDVSAEHDQHLAEAWQP